MKLLEESPAQNPKHEKRTQYEAPAIIYESLIATRAGTPTGSGETNPSGVDPSDLFGGG